MESHCFNRFVKYSLFCFDFGDFFTYVCKPGVNDITTKSNTKMKLTWQLFTLILFPFFCHSQNIEIKYIGNCAYRIKLDSVEIFTDFPYKSGSYGYMEYNMDSVDLTKPNQYLLFTHQHKDHYDGKLVRKSGKTKITPLMSKSKKNKYLKELEEKYGIRITYFKTHHRYSVKHRSLAIEWKGKKIFIFGDTEKDFPDYLDQNQIDLLIIAPWQVTKLKMQNQHYVIRNIAVYHLHLQSSGNTGLISKFLDEHLSFLPEKPGYIILQQYECKTIN